jgi:hypothetical protein
LSEPLAHDDFRLTRFGSGGSMARKIVDYSVRLRRTCMPVGWQQRNEKAQERFDSGRSIHNEAIVDAYGAEERAMGWYYLIK